MKETIKLILMRALVLIMILGHTSARYLLVDIYDGTSARVAHSDRSKGISWISMNK